MKFGYIGAEIIILKLFCLAFFLGVVFFIVWVVRTLDKKQLKKWVIGLLVVGLLGMIGSSLLMHKGKDGEKFGDWRIDKCEYLEKYCGDTEAE